MRLITQHRDKETGCGIACVAMLLGITYADAKERLFGSGEAGLTQTRHLKSVLREAGLETGDRLIPLGQRDYHDLDFNAILKTNVRQGGREWHWVVWDVKRRKLLDPKVPPYKKLKAVSFLKVMRTKQR